MRLAHASYGDGPPLIILHGLFGSGRNWTSMAKRLAGTGWRAITVDLRNHGASPHDAEMTYPAMAKDVRSLIDEMDLAAPVIIGHSMGGKTAMTLALNNPEDLRAAVVVDIAPQSYAHGNASLIDAMKAMDLSAVADRRSADEALKAGIEDDGVRAFLLQNLAFGKGDAAWRLNLDGLRANMPNLMDFPVEPGAAVFDGPVLFIAGERSDYMKDVDRKKLREFFPSARIAKIKGAGHWVHAEAPDAFFEIISGFLSGLDK